MQKIKLPSAVGLPVRGAKTPEQKAKEAAAVEKKARAKAKNAARGVYDEDSPEGLMAAHLRASAITYEQGVAAGLSAELDEFKRPIMRIEYRDFDGEPLGENSPRGPECRTRFLGTPPQRKDGKPQRYLQPTGSALGVYIPHTEGITLAPLFSASLELAATLRRMAVADISAMQSDLSWEAIATNELIPLVFTEGEKKALCLTLHGYPTLSLNGVYGYAASSKGMEAYVKGLAAMLEDLALRGRQIYIVFDSDVADNPGVAHALSGATKMLSERGAVVKTPVLPAYQDEAGVLHKQGADDFIVHHGAEAFGKLLSDAQPAAVTQFFLAYNQHMRVNFGTGDVERRADFMGVRTRFSNQPCSKVWVPMAKDKQAALLAADTVTEVAPDTGKKREVPFFTGMWMPSHSKPTYHGHIWSEESPGAILNGVLNRWQGFAHEPLEPLPGELEYFFERLEFLASDKPQMDFMLKRFAYAVQHPCEKKPWFNILHGMGGTGKSTISDAISMIFEGYVKNMTEKVLVSGFHQGIEAALVINVSEVPKHIFSQVSEMLKDYTGGESVEVAGKGSNSVAVMVNAMVNFTVNDPHNVLHSLGTTERRAVYSKLGSVTPHERDAAAYKKEQKVASEMRAWVRDSKRPGFRILQHYFMKMDLSDFRLEDTVPVPTYLVSESSSEARGSSSYNEFAAYFADNPAKVMADKARHLLALHDFGGLYTKWAAERGFDRTIAEPAKLKKALLAHGPLLAGTGQPIAVWKCTEKVNGDRQVLWVSDSRHAALYCKPAELMATRGPEVDKYIDAARAQYQKEHAADAPEYFKRSNGNPVKAVAAKRKPKKY